MRFVSIAALAAMVLLAGSAPAVRAADEKKDEHKHAMEKITMAVAVVHPTEGNACKGVVRFTEEEGGKVKIVADLEGLDAGKKHAFHIHQYGDCTKPDGTSAGGHYNPEGHDHAGPDAAKRHAGDLGNVTADKDGKAHYELTVDNISVGGHDKPNIIGRGVIVHKGEDDLKTQPTGNAGARIGCGVIGVANPGK